MKRASIRAVAAALMGAALAAAFAVSATAAAQAPPKTTSPPTIEGKVQVGETISAATGIWANSPTAYAYQWQRCTSNGSGCTAITGATAKTYKLTTADVGKTVRVLVTASNPAGRTTVNTDRSAVVQDTGGTTTVVTTTVAGNQAPTISFLSLKVRSNRVFVRFRVCDDSARVTVTARDSMPRRLAYVRRFVLR